MGTPPTRYSSDIAFTPAVKAIQAAKGSRQAYARMEEAGSWSTEISEELADFIARQRSFFLATANNTGQPYIQHRGGPPGFLRVIDAQTLGFADYRGNKQYISLGNLVENNKVHLFLIDYEEQSRVKIWGEALVVEEDPAMLSALHPAGYAAKPERAVLIRVLAWDANCRQHIPLRIEAEHVRASLSAKDQEIAALRTELARLRAHR